MGLIMGKAKDLTGQKFGRLKVLSRAANDSHGRTMWRCRCDCCGEDRIVQGYLLTSGQTKGCGKNHTPVNFINRTGQRYGMLTVLRLGEKTPSGDIRWVCRCDCGNEIAVIADSLNSGHTRSCGCLKAVNTNAKDITGERYGNLIVLNRAGAIKGKAAWNCLCDCGNRVVRTGDVLRQGACTHCGCRTGENHSNGAKRHGMSKTRLAHIWSSMKQRTENPDCNTYKYYGARGIKVCEEWKNSFETFRDWALTNGYSDKLTIDRIDVNKGYFPDNCRWVDVYIQANNKTDNHYITRGGETHTLADWCRILNVSKSTVFKRQRQGLPEEMWFEKEVRLTKKGVEKWQDEKAALLLAQT